MFREFSKHRISPGSHEHGPFWPRDTGLVSPPLNRLRSAANIFSMNCDHVMFTGHAVQRMFERRIQRSRFAT